MVEATYHYEKDILDRLISGQRQGIPIIEQQKRVELLRYMKEHRSKDILFLTCQRISL